MKKVHIVGNQPMMLLQFQFINLDEDEKQLIPDFCELLRSIIMSRINTKINRDYLEHSKYYNEKGFQEIFGKEIENNLNNVNKDKNYNKDIKKVKFSDIIVYDCEN